nr:bifunctional oligoribonuclease/PAP phosphatase NrnA [Lachnospiraceae bacterium]
MNETVKQQILSTIRAYDKIVLSRHVRPDGDAVGATLGLAALIRSTWPQKDVRVVNEDSSDFLAFLGPEDPAPADDFYADALAIVVDSGTADRVANPKIGLARETVVIDHHMPEEPWGDIRWVEPHRSSVCEMITEFYVFHRDELVLTPDAARALYTGIITDSNRFRWPSTSGDTLRLAAVLLEQGIDTETLFAHLYLEDYSYFKYKAYVYEHLQMTEHGVAYLFVTQEMQKLFGLDREAASNTVDLMDSIKGALIWLAFIENPDGVIRVRLRSRFTEVRPLASRWRGGGHDRASGATVYSWEEAEQLIAEADAGLAAFKAENKDWL